MDREELGEAVRINIKAQSQWFCDQKTYEMLRREMRGIQKIIRQYDADTGYVSYTSTTRTEQQRYTILLYSQMTKYYNTLEEPEQPRMVEMLEEEQQDPDETDWEHIIDQL